MSVKPILFSGPMVRAILEGRKTQTRRVLDMWCDKPPAFIEGGAIMALDPEEKPYLWPRTYAVGDLLWVREAFRGDKGYDSYPTREWSHWPVHYEADGEPDPNDEIGMNGRLRPGMFMPRWASRLTLRVTDVRVQRVQDISEADAVAEGVGPLKPVPGRPDLMWVHHGGERYSSPGYAFRELWDSLNAKRGFGWEKNPWVAAYTFEVIRQNVDEVAA